MPSRQGKKKSGRAAAGVAPQPAVRKSVKSLIADDIRTALTLSPEAQENYLSSVGWHGPNLLREWLAGLENPEATSTSQLQSVDSHASFLEVKMVQRGILNNHKIRHLTGISVRNLCITSSPKRTRGETTDDNALVSSHTSPQKLSVRRESQALEHSRSAVDLSKLKLEEDAVANGSTKPQDRNGEVKSPRPAKNMRRRSTLSWANESPASRQKHLEEAARERRVDAFASIHGPASHHVLHVTEVQHKTMNADFKFFDLTELGPISRQEVCRVKLFARPDDSVAWVPVLELGIELSGLEWVGKSLDDLQLLVTDNTIIFHLTDGIYIDPASRASFDPPSQQPQGSRTSSAKPVNTSSLDSLSKIKDLSECIDDALKTRDELSAQIESWIGEHHEPEETIAKAASAQASNAHTQEALIRLQREVSRLRAQLQRNKASLEQHKAALASGQKSLDDYQLESVEDRSEISRLRKEIAVIVPKIRAQKRRIAEDILQTFPIEPIPHMQLCFTIAGLHLPSASQFDGSSPFQPCPEPNENQTAAALGHVAQIVETLSTKLFVPLPYIITVSCSTSTIFDPLTPTDQLGGPTRNKLPPNIVPTPENSPWRTFLLSQKSNSPDRFKWAVYLLNKCIEEIMSKHNVKMVDPRFTLASLKALLMTLSAGQGELPKRQPGIVAWKKAIDSDERRPVVGEGVNFVDALRSHLQDQ